MFNICVCLGLKGLRSIPICPRGRGSRGRGASPAGDPRPLPRHPRTGESPTLRVVLLAFSDVSIANYVALDICPSLLTTDIHKYQ
eukprot:scaffold16988_cov130-Skeletonema_marinoi.AAC.2